MLLSTHTHSIVAEALYSSNSSGLVYLCGARAVAVFKVHGFCYRAVVEQNNGVVVSVGKLRVLSRGVNK